jgi:hypothetical protein
MFSRMGEKEAGVGLAGERVCRAGTVGGNA